MASFNRVILIGNLTRDPEIKYLPSQTAVCDLGLAVNDRYKGKTGEWVEEVTFVDVTLWGRTAEVASEYLSKGSPVFIEGRLKLESWTDKEGGKRSKLKVVGDRLQLIGAKGSGGSGGGQRGSAARGPQRGPAEDEYRQSDPGDSYDSPGPEPSSGGDDIPF